MLEKLTGRDELKESLMQLKSNMEDMHQEHKEQLNLLKKDIEKVNKSVSNLESAKNPPNSPAFLLIPSSAPETSLTTKDKEVSLIVILSCVSVGAGALSGKLSCETPALGADWSSVCLGVLLETVEDLGKRLLLKSR